MYGAGESGPNFMFTILFFLTAALGLFLSNTASAVLVAPIAIIAAKTNNISGMISPMAARAGSQNRLATSGAAARKVVDCRNSSRDTVPIEAIAAS